MQGKQNVKTGRRLSAQDFDAAERVSHADVAVAQNGASIWNKINILTNTQNDRLSTGK